MKVLLALLAAALLVPAAQAQVEADASMTILGFDGQATNATVAALPFELQLDVSGFPCVGEGARMVVALSAEATGNHSVEVQPATMTFVVPVNAGLAGYSHAQGGAVLLAPSDVGPGNATVTLTALMTDIEGCATASTSGFEVSAETQVEFLAPAGSTTTGTGQAMPGPGLGLLALALGAVAFARRK